MLLIRRRRAGREGAGGSRQGVRQRVPAVRRGQGAQRLRTRPGRQGDSLLGTGHFQFHTKKEAAGGKNSGAEDYIVLVTKIKIKSYSSGVALG